MNKHNQVDAQPPIRGAQSPALKEGTHTHQNNSLTGWLYLSPVVDERSTFWVRLLGYGLLLFALLDYIYIIIPLRLTNPEWEFQTIGALVEHAAVPLLGLMFVFYRQEGYIRKLEKNLLGLLSWVSLLVGLLYLLMLPLGIVDTWRLYHASNTQIANQLSKQTQQFEQITDKLNQAQTDSQLKNLFASLTPQGRSPQINNPQAFKDEFLAQISQAQRSRIAQADSVRTNRTQALLKSSFKWNLGALVAGVLFIWSWHLSHWARTDDCE